MRIPKRKCDVDNLIISRRSCKNLNEKIQLFRNHEHFRVVFEFWFFFLSILLFFHEFTSGVASNPRLTYQLCHTLLAPVDPVRRKNCNQQSVRRRVYLRDGNDQRGPYACGFPPLTYAPVSFCCVPAGSAKRLMTPGRIVNPLWVLERKETRFKDLTPGAAEEIGLEPKHVPEQVEAWGGKNVLIGFASTYARMDERAKENY